MFWIGFFILVSSIAVTVIIAANPKRVSRKENTLTIRMDVEEFVDYAEWLDEKKLSKIKSDD
jgi:hypothetical protein